MKTAIAKKVLNVKELIAKLKDYKIITVINLEGLRTKQLNKLRSELNDDLNLIVTTKNCINRALKDSGIKGLDGLIAHIKGVCGLGLSNSNPFRLSIKLKSMTTPAPAKAGQVAPTEITVSKGPTMFTPGPIMTELTQLGIKTKVEAGKLSILNDSTIVSAGQVINNKQASMMAKLGITPMSMGLNLIAAFEEGRVFGASELLINVSEYLDKVSNAYLNAYNLAFNTETPVSDVIKVLLMTASNYARNLSMNAGIITGDNASEFLMLANAKAQALVHEIKWEVK